MEEARLSSAGALFAVLVLVALPGLGHERHTPAPPASPAAPATDAVEPAPEEEERPEAAPLQIDAQVALGEHIHNKVVHFPMALGITGAALLLLSYRWPQFGPGARLLLVVAALSAWIAVTSGLAQEEALEGGELEVWLERHELSGKVTAGALTLVAALALVKQARPFHWLLALLAIGLLSWTGFLGGILAHTPV